MTVIISFFYFSLDPFFSRLWFSFEFFLYLDLLLRFFKPLMAYLGFFGLSSSEIRMLCWLALFSLLLDFLLFFSLSRVALSWIFVCLLPSKFRESFFLEQLWTEDFFSDVSVFSFLPYFKSSFSAGTWGLEWNSSSLLIATLY